MSRLPKGVTELPRPRGGRRFQASIRRGKGVSIHLGLYETPWLAAYAYGLAAEAVGRPGPPLDIPRAEQPDAARVRAIAARVRARLGLDPDRTATREIPPPTDELLTLFEVTIVGFWRGEAARDVGDHPEAGLDAAASRLVDAARMLFWSPTAGHPRPLDALTELLARRIERTFRRADLARGVLDDDGDEPWRVARWLTHPDSVAGGRLRGFRDEIRHLYIEPFAVGSDAPSWARTLGIGPPFDLDRVRAAYRTLSRTSHPDAGGDEAAFVRLRAAYEEALDYCRSMAR